jgi:hypothetical protein
MMGGDEEPVRWAQPSAREKEGRGVMGSWATIVGQPVGPVELAGLAADFRDCRPMMKVKALELYYIKSLSLSLNLDTFQIQTSHK